MDREIEREGVQCSPVLRQPGLWGFGAFGAPRRARELQASASPLQARDLLSGLVELRQREPYQDFFCSSFHVFVFIQSLAAVEVHVWRSSGQ